MSQETKKKIKVLNDRQAMGWDTEFICRNKSTGEVLFKTHNKLVIGGATFTLEKISGVTADFKPATLNKILGIDGVDAGQDHLGPLRDDKICMLVIGLDGSGDAFGEVVAVDYKTAHIPLDKIVPFRYLKPDHGQLLSEYCMKKMVNGYEAYYGKRIITPPVIKSYFADGTPVSNDVATSVKKEEIDTYLEYNFDVSKADAREFFEAEKGGIKNCRINTIALYTGVPVKMAEEGDRIEIADARMLSKINFNNEALDDDVKELDFIYRIYIK